MNRKMIKKAVVLCATLATILMAASASWAVSYYDAGDSSWGNTGNLSLREFYYGGTQAIQFRSTVQNLVTGPITDNIATGSDNYQAISGTYTLSTTGTAGVYNLSLVSGTASTVTVTNDTFGDLLTAYAKALQINFNTHTISWSAVTLDSVTNSIASTVLDDLLTATSYAFSTFSFQALSTESTWLSGTTGTYNAQYYSRMEGFMAAPEPAEWVLMLLGLGMLGFYLHRRGFLNFGRAPEAAA